MIYQLPTGKIVYMSLQTYLDLTEEDIQYLVSTGTGASPNNPFHGTAMKPTRATNDDEETHDHSLDYQPESEEVEVEHAVDLDNLPDPDTVD